jgi:long-chain acyl-CoA synthetase
VPRLYNLFYGKIMDGAKAGGIKGWLIKKGIEAKLANVRAYGAGTYTHCFWDALVFNKVKQILGGKMRLMITGAAPIDLEV